MKRIQLLLAIGIMLASLAQQPFTNFPPVKKVSADPSTSQTVEAPIQPVKTVALAQPIKDETPAPVQELTPVAEPTPTPVAAPAPTYSSHEDMMAAAGISSGDYGAVEYIISHESGWNPDATNASSGAHGLPQAYPYSKTGCGWDDGICQLQWADGYAKSRYGGWQQAYYYWVGHGNW